MATDRISKERIQKIVYSVLGRMIVDFETACPDVISKSEYDELVDKLYEECNGRQNAMAWNRDASCIYCNEHSM